MVNVGVKLEVPVQQRELEAEREIEVRIINASLFYGRFQALRNISMDIPADQITAIIGPSGSGKSSLLRTINRMNEVIPGARLQGKVLVSDHDIYAPSVEIEDVRKKVGMVFQRPNPFPQSIYDNVAYGPRVHGLKERHKLDEIVEGSLMRAAIWDEVKDKLNQSALALSGGQQQRVCIARALAVDPEVLLMDEPASALDPISTLKIEDLMRELRQSYTVVIVTHNMQQAARVSDFTAVLMVAPDRAGILVEFGETSQIFTNPRDKRTEDYITGRLG